jgi:hypothetical protein
MYTADRFMPTRGQIKNAALVDVPIGTPDTSVHYDPVTAAVVGTVGGAMISGSAAKSAAKTSAAAQDRAAQLAYEQSLPWDVTGAGGGSVFDEEGKAAALTLSPELQAAYGTTLGRAGMWTGSPFFQQYAADPFGLQQKIYEQQLAGLAPQRQRDWLALENRLGSQGTRGLSVGGQGNPLARAYFQAQEEANLGLFNQALTTGQGLIDTALGREQADYGQALQFLDVPLQYANLGRGIGGSLSSAATAGAQLRAQGAQQLAATQAAGAYGASNAFSRMLNNQNFQNQISGMFSSTYAPTMSQGYTSPQANSWQSSSGGWGSSTGFDDVNMIY